MKNKTLESKTDTQPNLSPYQAERAEAQRTPVLRPGPLGGTLAPPGSEATLRAHAAGLNRATAGRTLRRLQRQYGNRYVQRVVERVQQRSSGEGFQLDDETAGRINRARCGGLPLDSAVQAQMSEALGYDFSGVRVHTGPEADELNQQLHAKAFTTGPDIFFRRGEYTPGSPGSRELIAHELSHVVQQSTGRVNGNGRGMTVRPAGDVFEQEAAGVAGHSVGANHETVGQVATGEVQRMAAARVPMQQTGGTCGLYSLGMAISAVDSTINDQDKGPLMNEILGKAAEVGTFVGEFFDADNLVKVANKVKYNTNEYGAAVMNFENQDRMKSCLNETGTDAVLMAYSVKEIGEYGVKPDIDPELCAHWSVVEGWKNVYTLKVRDPNTPGTAKSYSVAEFFRWNESTEAKTRFSFAQFQKQLKGNVEDLWVEWREQLLAVPADKFKRLVALLERKPKGVEIVPIKLKGKIVKVWKK